MPCPECHSELIPNTDSKGQQILCCSEKHCGWIGTPQQLQSAEVLAAANPDDPWEIRFPEPLTAPAAEPPP